MSIYHVFERNNCAGNVDFVEEEVHPPPESDGCLTKPLTPKTKAYGPQNRGCTSYRHAPTPSPPQGRAAPPVTLPDFVNRYETGLVTSIC